MILTLLTIYCLYIVINRFRDELNATPNHDGSIPRVSGAAVLCITVCALSLAIHIIRFAMFGFSII